MAPTFRAAASNSGVNDVSITIPATVQAGDGMTLVAYANIDCVIATPQGWQVAKAQESAEAGGITAVVFKRVAQAGDANSTVTVTNDGVVPKAQALLIAHADVDTSDPVHLIDSAASTGGSPGFTTPQITTTLPDCTVLEIYCGKASDTTEFTAYPAGSTPRVSLIGTGGGHPDGAIVDRAAATPGTYGGGTFTLDANQSSALTYTIALAPRSSTQTLRPTSDVTTGNYTAVPPVGTGVAMAARIGEAVRDDNTYIQSPTGPSGALYEARLTAGLDPVVGTGHTVSVVLSKAGGSTTAECTVSLVEGNTIISSETFEDLTDTPEVYTWTLDEVEADAITNYGDLRLRFEATAS